MELVDIIILAAVTGGAGYFLWKKFFLAGGCGCGSGCSSCGDDCNNERVKMEKVYGIKEQESPVVKMGDSRENKQKK